MPGSIAGNGSATVNALVALYYFSGEWVGNGGRGEGEAKLIRGELNSACFSFKLFCCVDVVIALVFSLLHVVILMLFRFFFLLTLLSFFFLLLLFRFFLLLTLLSFFFMLFIVVPILRIVDLVVILLHVIHCCS